MSDVMPWWAWALVIALAAVAVLALAAVARSRGARRRAEAELASLRARTDELDGKMEALAAAVERRVDPTRESADESAESVDRGDAGADEPGYLITAIDDPHDEDSGRRAEQTRIQGTLFADLVLRESAVRTFSLAAGLRRALAPETRNRIRFAMRQEVKRARKARLRDLRVARREYETRQREAA